MREDSAGIVHLAGGFIANNPCCVPVGDVVTSVVLPVVRLSFAPSWNVFEIVHTNFGTYADVEIQTDGTIHVIPPRPPAITDFHYLSLDGLTFAAASPKFFGLAVRGAAKQGATVTVMLRKPRVLALQVRTMRRHRLVTVGVVRLGRHRAGRSKIHWNLRINGRPLLAGRYQISLHALNGNILSVPAPPGPRTPDRPRKPTPARGEMIPRRPWSAGRTRRLRGGPTNDHSGRTSRWVRPTTVQADGNRCAHAATAAAFHEEEERDHECGRLERRRARCASGAQHPARSAIGRRPIANTSPRGPR